MLFIIKLTLWIIAYTAGIIRLSLAVVLMAKKRSPEDLWKIGFLISFSLCIISLSNMETLRQTGLDYSLFGTFATYGAAGITLTLPIYMSVSLCSTYVVRRVYAVAGSSAGLSVILLSVSHIFGVRQIQSAAFVITIGGMVISIIFSMVLLGLHRKPGLYDKIISVFVVIAIPLMIYIDFILHYAETYLVLPVMYLVINVLMILSETGSFSISSGAGSLDDEKMTNAGLTSREREVTCLLVKGYTYRKIADELFISLETVKSHASKIYQKTGTCNKMELLQALGKT